MSKTRKEFPKLYGKTSTGKIKEWEIRVDSKANAGDIAGVICTTHGLEYGKKQVDYVMVTKGKNIGRSNETTPVEQAISQAQSKWNGKIDECYAENIADIPEDTLPMLAKTYDDFKHKIEYPCYVQPKLDGVRCLAKMVDGEIQFFSRKGKRYMTIEHISEQLKSCMNLNEVLDGEIYIHGEEFQDIISAVKNVKNKSTTLIKCRDLEYHIYDIADKNNHFKNRLNRLNKLNICGINIIVVDTYVVNNEDEMKHYHNLFTADNYEGIIIRNKQGKYQFDSRSNNLQKYKHFLDEEFEIVGVKCGTGRYEKCGTFICRMKNGNTFDVNAKGTIAKKQEYLRNKNKYIGKLLTVKFQEKSKEGVPRFPVGLAVRDYE